MVFSTVVLFLQLQTVNPAPAVNVQPAVREVSPQAIVQGTETLPIQPHIRRLGSLTSFFDALDASEGNQQMPASFLPGQLKETPVPPVDATPAANTVPANENADGAASPAFRPRREEVRRRKYMWYGLAFASHGAAAFDAWSTRRVISSGRGHEANPFFRPFAGSGALYVAVQVMPTLTDYLGNRMRASRRPWFRRVWWLPQATSTAWSIASGVHNLHVYHRSAPDLTR